MADKSGIEWTDATWNPIRGCTRVSPGCGGPGPHGGCYAERVAARFSGPGMPYENLAEMKGGKARWTGKLVQSPDATRFQPLRWRRPRRIFVNSMSDLFHEAVPDAWIDEVFAVMALCPQHTFQVLTKRSARMREVLQAVRRPGLPERVTGVISRFARDGFIGSDQANAAYLRPVTCLPNVWLGVSAEDQQRADERVSDLLQTPATIRFVSAEPLLGPIDFRSITDLDQHATEPWPHNVDALTGELSDSENGPVPVHEPGSAPRLDWIIAGGESGPGARPMHSEWVRSIRDQCATTGTAFFFKQWGAWRPIDLDREAGETRWMIVGRAGDQDIPDDRAPDEAIGEIAMCPCGKASAGRHLDGRTHDGLPGRP